MSETEYWNWISGELDHIDEFAKKLQDNGVYGGGELMRVTHEIRNVSGISKESK